MTTPVPGGRWARSIRTSEARAGTGEQLPLCAVAAAGVSSTAASAAVAATPRVLRQHHDRQEQDGNGAAGEQPLEQRQPAVLAVHRDERRRALKSEEEPGCIGVDRHAGQAQGCLPIEPDGVPGIDGDGVEVLPLGVCDPAAQCRRYQRVLAVVPLEQRQRLDGRVEIGLEQRA
jgi:hypothetical protein